jgi:hypothetical protein
MGEEMKIVDEKIIQARRDDEREPAGVMRFSNYYAKMPTGWQTSLLLDVIPIELSDLSQAFVEYDTTTLNGGTYLLPKSGSYLLLLLRSTDGHLWTTIRRSTPKKKEYYLGKRGQAFRCVVEEGRK